MDFVEPLTVFAVPGKQVALLAKEQGDEILLASNSKAKSAEDKERIALEVKRLFSKPDKKPND